MATIYYDDDADLGLVQARKVAVLGYGSQGHAHALNLKDSGCEVRVGLAPGSSSRGKAWDLAKSYARAIGGTKAGALVTTFQEETETDLFGEQAVLCGGTTALVQAGFETLVEAGYQPEVAYFECLHELKLIVDLVQKYGIAGMYNRVSETARYGGLTRGPYVLDQETKKKMKEVLKQIQSGQFAEEWISKYKKEGKNSFVRHMKEIENHQIEKVGKEMRTMMWPEAPEV